MRPSPARFLIESLFLTPDAIPTDVVQTVIIPDRFDHVSSLSIAPFTAMNRVVFSGYHDLLAEILSCSELPRRTWRRFHSLNTPR
jgi:hypothetical protein